MTHPKRTFDQEIGFWVNIFHIQKLIKLSIIFHFRELEDIHTISKACSVAAQVSSQHFPPNTFPIWKGEKLTGLNIFNILCLNFSLLQLMSKGKSWQSKKKYKSCDVLRSPGILPDPHPSRYIQLSICFFFTASILIFNFLF